MSKSQVIREDQATPSVVPEEADQRSTTLERLTRDHHDFLSTLARKLCGRHFDPEDLVQEVLLRALANRDRLPEVRNHRAWMTTVMKNLFMDQLRRAKTRETYDQAALELESGDAPWWQGLDGDHVREAMSELPVELRETFERFAFRHQPYEEIARALAIPKATVGTRIVRARRRLRAVLEKRRLS